MKHLLLLLVLVLGLFGGYYWETPPAVAAGVTVSVPTDGTGDNPQMP